MKGKGSYVKLNNSDRQFEFETLTSSFYLFWWYWAMVKIRAWDRCLYYTSQCSGKLCFFLILIYFVSQIIILLPWLLAHSLLISFLSNTVIFRFFFPPSADLWVPLSQEILVGLLCTLPVRWDVSCSDSRGKAGLCPWPSPLAPLLVASRRLFAKPEPLYNCSATGLCLMISGSMNTMWDGW